MSLRLFHISCYCCKKIKIYKVNKKIKARRIFLMSKVKKWPLTIPAAITGEEEMF